MSKNKGLISVQVEDDKKLIDISELIRVFGNIQVENSSKEHVRTVEYTENTSDKNKVIELSELQLLESKQREMEANIGYEDFEININTIKNFIVHPSIPSNFIGLLKND